MARLVGLLRNDNVNFVFLFLNCVAFVWASTNTVVVDSPFGKLRGEVVPGDQSHVVFRNIPYAKPPVGELRFVKTQPHPKIDNVFDATDRKEVVCPHPDEFLFGREQGTEDCLILNIFAKNVNGGGKLKKVMVFIHGGGFVAGWSSFYNLGSFVYNYDVIGVNINYRLGILGFLSTGNEAGPGNYGLWDQALAIKWVKDNIRAFGGDPDDITISGESAGSASVAYQSLSPVNKGLFSKACPQSGTATSVFAGAIHVQKHALMIGKRANCWEGEITDKIDLKQSEALMKCLRNADVSVFTGYSFYGLDETRFVPSVDGDFVPNKPSLLIQDEAYLESIGFYDRSYLVSIVNNEYAIMRGFYDNLEKAIQGNWDMTEEEKQNFMTNYVESVKKAFTHARLDNANSDSASQIAENIMEYYNRRKVGEDALFDMVTDLSFLIPSYDFLNAASRRQQCKSWFLFFNHFPAFMKGQQKGTVHAADLIYWHDIPVETMGALLNVNMTGEMNEEDLQLKALFSSILAEFMKTGNPGTALKEQIPSGWPVYDPSSSHYLNFNPEPTVRSHLEREKRDLWLKKVPKWEKNKSHEHTEL